MSDNRCPVCDKLYPQTIAGNMHCPSCGTGEKALRVIARLRNELAGQDALTDVAETEVERLRGLIAALPCYCSSWQPVDCNAMYPREPDRWCKSCRAKAEVSNG